MIDLFVMEVIGDFISVLIMMYFFNRVMPPKNKRYSQVCTIIMIIIYTLIPANYTNNVIFNIQGNRIFLFIFSYYILVLIYPIVFRKGRMTEKFFLSSVYLSIMLIISFIVLIVFAEIFNTTIAEIAFYGNYKKSIAMFIDRFIQFICISILSKNISFIKYIKNKTLYVGGTILVLHHILIFIMERDLVKRLDRININIIIIVFSLCIIQILLIYVLNTFSKETEEKFLLKMELDRKIHDEEIIDMYTRMIRWKHDARNHISMILGLLEAGTKEEVISYINEITSNITKLDKNMYSNNIAINSILMSKMKMAEEKNIKVNLNLKIDSEIKISNVDICIIMGNLFDNSIEACDVIEGDKFIDLKIASEMNRLVIKISNNTNGYVNEVNGKFLTTKHSNMNGIGLIQVDKAVKKYNGYINRKHENNIFTTYLMV